MLSPDRPFDAPLSAPERRSLLVICCLVGLGIALSLLYTPALDFLQRQSPPPGNLWPGEVEAPSSYEFIAQTSGGEVRQWAVAPGKWRHESPGRIEMSDGSDVWHYQARTIYDQGAIYWSLPYGERTASGELRTGPPYSLYGGQPAFISDMGTVSTRRPYLAPS